MSVSKCTHQDTTNTPIYDGHFHDEDLDSESENSDSVNEISNSEDDIRNIIYPGLVINNNYIIISLIGSGNNATVWLCYNLSKGEFYAMKIQYHECYNDGCREVVILQNISKHIAANPSKNINCIQMLDYFCYVPDQVDESAVGDQNDENAPNKYMCSVYELYAGSIQMLVTNGIYKYGLPINIVKDMLRKILTALDVLHSDLNIIHTDIKPANILIRGEKPIVRQIIDLFVGSGFIEKAALLRANVSDENEYQRALSELATEAVVEIRDIKVEFGEEEIDEDDEEDDEDDYFYDNDSTEPSDLSESSEVSEDNVHLERNQSVPDILDMLAYTNLHDLDDEGIYNLDEVLNRRQVSTDHEIIIDEQSLNNCDVVLTDFGNSYFYKSRTRNEIQDRLYRAPEIILDLNYGYSCDVWSVACVAFELLTGYDLFKPNDSHYLNRDIHHLYLMEKFLGPMPKKMKRRSRRRPFLFDKNRDYSIKNLDNIVPFSLQERLETQFLFSKSDSKEISEFLIFALEYDPMKRPTARELLHHSWLSGRN